MATFPTTLEEITPRFLGEVLDAPVTGIEILPVDRQGATTLAARIGLEYESPQGGSGPRAIFAKLVSPHEAVQQMAAETGIYRREVRFYRDLAPDSGLAVPHCYFAEWDRASGRFLLLLEDMAGGSVGDIFGSRLEQVEAVGPAIAPFHTRWWRNPQLARMRWLVPPEHPLAIAALGGAFQAALGSSREAWPDAFAGALGEVSDRIASDYGLLAGRFARRPQTLVHGDLHLQQVFFPGAGGGRFAIFDWQTIGLGFAGQDLARTVATCLTPQMRRTHERELVAGHHRALVASGVVDYDLAECWDDYRLGILWSVVTNVVAAGSIDWRLMDLQARQSGETFTGAFFGRLEEALRDLEVIALLD